ncbi:two-component system activity regulator YycH [Listeria cossartiae]|uniref:two-component system activity regulator YycH n=1 Tax=Listeria TaxID=1637 RepID=UPI00162619ED|nr:MULTISPECIES: two-component system activity regulator YycH [Listeria]MBC2012102.1 transcriptional regulator [Listeria marthii]MBC2074245.1 transcriptional regulator [Listeria marthii]MBC2076897.1 transcriptional regulator [Listeria marthii]MBC2101972.1 transcriptional regulator [Listeria marthii]MBF2392802.1 transcriptional regulator [Listeria marthii]
MMKKTGFRSFVLTILVVLSIVLSYFIWKGQPDYEAINVKEIEKTTIDKTMTTSQVFKPYKLAVNSNDNNYQSLDADLLNELMAQGKAFSFSEVVLANKKSSEDYEKLIHKNGTIEIIFPNDIPFSIFAQIFQVEGEGLESAFFNRIVFDINNTDTGLHSVYFANDDQENIYQSSLQNKDIDKIEKIVKKNEGKLTQNDKLLSNKRNLFLSTEKTKLDRKKYIIDSLEINLFTSALFQDSGTVKSEGNTYTDGSSVIEMDTDNKVLEYVNPSQERTNPEDLSSVKRAGLIQDSFNFVNDHAGWTGDGAYYFTGYAGESATTNFSLFIDNLQVYNENGMADISVTEGLEAVYKYMRPFFRLDTDVPGEKKEVTLQSSYSVYSALAQNPNVNAEEVEDIVPGYHMTRSESSGMNRLVTLEPTWLYKYHDKWFIFQADAAKAGE